MVKLKKNKKVVFFIIIDALMLISLFIFYGPVAIFRDLWISSAMTTATHKYLARTIYTEGMINKSISDNISVNVKEDTDASQVKIGDIKETEIYTSIYEEQILKRDEGNDLYKVIDISGTGWKGHLVAIYDATKVSLGQSPKIKTGGQILDKLASSLGAVVAMNASGFVRKGATLVPTGSTIMDGQIVHDGKSPDGEAGLIGFNKDGVLILSSKEAQKAIDEDGIVDAMEFWPFLVVNGKKTEFSGNGGWGIAPRTAIGQRKDGIVMFVVIDGRRAGHSIGISMKELAEVMYNYGAYNASNLDGGGSSSLFVKDDIISVAGGAGYSGDRYLPNAWILTE